MHKAIRTIQSAALIVGVSLSGLACASAQEPTSPDKPASERRRPTGDAPTGAPTVAKDLCGNPKESGPAKPTDSSGGDILKPAPTEGEAPPMPPAGGGGGGGRGRRGGGGAAPAAGASDKNAFDYELPGPDGKGVPLCTFKGKTIMVVNLGRKSAYATQIAGLEKLNETYKDKLVVIGVPSDEFGAAEPGTDADIQKVYKVDDKVTFPVMAKSEITGDKELPFYEWLGKAEGGPVHWNFTKFFIDKNGKVVARFDPAVAPDSIEMQAAIPEILAGTYKAPGTGDAAPSGRRGGGMGAPPMD
jgi:glutathione peroxidase